MLGGSLGTTLELWAPAARRLAAEHRVIAFEHRGHGASPEPPGPYAMADLGGDVVALLDELELETVGYAGVSIGGMVGLWLATHAPQRLRTLVTICSTAHPGNAATWHERAATVRAAGSTAPIADAVVERWVTPAFAEAEPGRVEQLLAMLRAAPPEGYAACCEAIAAFDVRDRLADVRVPTTVVHARDDHAMPYEHGELVAATVPGARLVPLRPGAHLPMVERPDDVADLVAAAQSG